MITRKFSTYCLPSACPYLTWKYIFIKWVTNLSSYVTKLKSKEIDQTPNWSSSLFSSPIWLILYDVVRRNSVLVTHGRELEGQKLFDIYYLGGTHSSPIFSKGLQFCNFCNWSSAELCTLKLSMIIHWSR